MMNLRVLRHAANDMLRRYGWQIQQRQVDLLDFIKAKNVTTVLDVGANQGQYATGLRVRGYRNRIVSFEPDLNAFQQLEAMSRSDPLWFARNLAIGARDGDATFNMSHYNEFNSFLSPSAILKKYDRRATVEKQQKVAIARIDSLFKEFEAERVFLKSDTQGYEKNVVLGAADSLPRILGVQLEVGFFELYEGQPSFTDILDLMKSYRFSLALIWPNHYYDADPVRLMEVDCVFVNERSL
jgi:FkbM family methyltransferase